jgi:hypothetical protein
MPYHYSTGHTPYSTEIGRIFFRYYVCACDNKEETNNDNDNDGA